MGLLIWTDKTVKLSREEWKEFRQQKAVSASQLLHIMLKESLTGQARRLCRDLEKEEDVLKKLSKMFGSAKYLIAAKKDEISKLKVSYVVGHSFFLNSSLSFSHDNSFHNIP